LPSLPRALTVHWIHEAAPGSVALQVRAM
jgi:hypothetical protein